MIRLDLRRGARLAALGILGSAGALGLSPCLEACGVAQGGGERVVLDTQVALASDGASFTTASGWDVALTRAVLSTGPFYYYDGSPLASLAAGPVDVVRRESLGLLGLGLAHAHPGHEHTGQALGQMLSPWSVDLLAGMASYPAGEGVTGTYRSASFSFASTAAGPHAEDLGAYAALAEGVARRSDVLVRFRAVARWSDIALSTAQGNVDGCQLSEVAVHGSGVVTLTVHPSVWFDDVDFSSLPVASDDAPLELPLGSAPQLAFVEGLVRLSAYEFAIDER